MWKNGQEQIYVRTKGDMVIDIRGGQDALFFQSG